MSALAEHGQNYPVHQVMTREFETADASEMLNGAAFRLKSSSCRIMPVMKNGLLHGLLTSENIGEFMMIQSALKQSARSSVPA